eukprot:CAMPEP_0118816588 /NCGR_PEP_ID=MMETSP1162-20130426/4870_1 /TAXON_ID=33656 /ORGANISM="Phaeocystis Sp, Strain CCMP2710" /LENGTH=128 /DNA_ID=CAMNT_0006746617 /DNA_START=499 /DNA_END=885 /DNA_ORIENTATION=-
MASRPSGSLLESCCCLSIGSSRPSGHLQLEEQVRLAVFAASGRVRGRARGGCESGRRLCGPRRASRARSDRQSLVSELEEARQAEPGVPLLGVALHLEAVHERHRVARDLDRARACRRQRFHVDEMDG